MRLDVRIGGRARRVKLVRLDNSLHFSVNGREVEADALEVAPGTYSILLGGQSFEATVQAAGDTLRVHCGTELFSIQVLDPRVWHRKLGGVIETEGRQQITAPMPGKIVQLLVKAGDRVDAGQGLLVVEAMKMQNEIRTPKTGVVERLLVSPGQAVNAGEILAIIS